MLFGADLLGFDFPVGQFQLAGNNFFRLQWEIQIVIIWQA